MFMYQLPNCCIWTTKLHMCSHDSRIHGSDFFTFYRLSDSQKELDMKFGEFSEKVFGMFLTDPEDIKTLKMAENMVNYERKLKSKKKKIVSI